MRTARCFGYLLIVPAALVMALFLLLPILSAIVDSLHIDSPLSTRRFVGLQNYGQFFADPAATGTCTFTLLFVGASVALELMLGLIMALILHQGFRGRGLARAALLIPWALPTVVTGIMWKYMLNDQYGLVNLLLHGANLESYQAFLAEPTTARLAIIVADVWKTASFAALLILAGLQTIPDELHEAARVDGAGAGRRFLAITLPLLRPAILIALLFRLMDAFRVFDLVYVMTQGAPGGATCVLQFYGYQKLFPEQQFGYGSAVAVLVFLVVGILSLITIRLLGRGTLEGGQP